MLTWVLVDGSRIEDLDLAREMFLEYQRELGIDLCFQSFEEELATLPGRYGPPAGCLVLVYWDGDLAACGALRPLQTGICELKRIYVRPDFRRKGIAKQISERLIEFGRQQGYKICRLDTLKRLVGAVEMYEGLGFAETHPYNFNPEPDIVYMELPLKP